MSPERKESIYRGPKLFSDSREVIYDTNLAKLPKAEQKVYLEGGYHTLVGLIFSDLTYTETLTSEQRAYIRNRLARELIDCSALAHNDKLAVNSLVEYFDRIADPCVSPELSKGARHLAVNYIYGEASSIDLIEKPSAKA